MPDTQAYNLNHDISPSGDLGIPFLVGKNTLNSLGMLDINERLSRNYKLSFSPKDIKYIIVKKESERLSIARRVEAIKSPKYNNDVITQLISRMITVTQIFEDF